MPNTLSTHAECAITRANNDALKGLVDLQMARRENKYAEPSESALVRAEKAFLRLQDELHEILFPELSRRNDDDFDVIAQSERSMFIPFLLAAE